MKKIIKIGFTISYLIIAIAMLITGGLLLQGGGKTVTVNASETQRAEDTTVITATAKYKQISKGVEDSNWTTGGGSLELNTIPLEADGVSQYTYKTGTKDIIVRAIPNSYYNFSKFIVKGVQQQPFETTQNPYTILRDGVCSEDIEIEIVFEMQQFELVFQGRFWDDLENTKLGNSEKTEYLSSLGMAPYAWSHISNYTTRAHKTVVVGEALGLEDPWGSESGEMRINPKYKSGTNSSTWWDEGVLGNVMGIRWNCWYVRSNEGYYTHFGRSRSWQPVLTEAFLNEYVRDANKIYIIGSYSEVVKVSINTGSDSGEDSIMDIRITTPVTGAYGYSNTTSLTNAFIDKDATITVQARASRFYNFTGFSINGTQNVNTQIYLELANAIDSNNEIKVVASFTKISYRISVGGIDSQGIPVDISGKASLTIGNTQNASSIYIFDILTSVNFEGISGYRQNGISAKFGNTFVNISEGQILDEEFLDKYLSGSEIVIYVNLIQQITVDVVIPKTSQNMGTFAIYYDNGIKANTNVFDYGTKIVIKASINNIHFDFKNYTNVLLTEIDDSDNSILNITLTYSRTINLYFISIPFEIIQDNNINSNGSITVSNTQSVKVGDIVYITIDTANGYDIKSWEINGVAVSKLSNAEVSGNVVKLEITSEWLKQFGNSDIILTNNVNVGMKTILLVAIIAPSILIPVLAGILLFFFIVNSRRKKFIKAELTEQLRAQVTLNAGQFIRDLREGKNVGAVTDADVKKAMKEKKKK